MNDEILLLTRKEMQLAVKESEISIKKNHRQNIQRIVNTYKRTGCL